MVDWHAVGGGLVADKVGCGKVNAILFGCSLADIPDRELPSTFMTTSQTNSAYSASNIMSASGVQCSADSCVAEVFE